MRVVYADQESVVLGFEREEVQSRDRGSERVTRDRWPEGKRAGERRCLLRTELVESIRQGREKLRQAGERELSLRFDAGCA